MYTGNLVLARTHFDKAIELYDRVEHRPLATRFGQDSEVAILAYRSRILWLLGYPDVAQADAECSLKSAREIGQAATLMFALAITSFTQILCGNYATATANAQELSALAEEKGALLWKAANMINQGGVWSLSGKASKAIQLMTSSIAAYQSTGATIHLPWYLSYLATAYVELGLFDDARRCLGEAMTAAEATKEKWCEAEVHRIAGEIALKSPERDAADAQTHFERALTVARQQQAKSWELRAAMSMARLWRSQGNPQQARELLAPVYGWFTEGFDTRDLKEAKALLEELAS